MKKKCEYFIATAEGNDPTSAANELSRFVQKRIGEGFEPLLGMGILPGLMQDQQEYVAYQSMLRVEYIDDEVTGTPPGAATAVTPPDKPFCLNRNSPDWEGAWEALRKVERDITEWMYMTTSIDQKTPTYYIHSFKHINTRQYTTVAVLRAC